MSGSMKIRWIDFKAEPQSAPDPKYPNGIDIDISRGAKEACTVQLTYPAPRCGVYRLECELCGLSVGITTAGRPDDPRSVTVACKRKVKADA